MKLSTRRILGLGAVAGVALTLGTGSVNPAHAADNCVPVLGITNVCVYAGTGPVRTYVSAGAANDNEFYSNGVGGELRCYGQPTPSWHLAVQTVVEYDYHETAIDTGLPC